VCIGSDVLVAIGGGLDGATKGLDSTGVETPDSLGADMDDQPVVLPA
jgi:hypothetical protein